MMAQWEPRRSVRCVSCHQSYSAEDWRALGEVKTLGREEISRHVVTWPEGYVVEVRACVRCGRALPWLRATPSGESQR
jgi:hypothetical protein